MNPKIGFVSLGCPKALVDSERILTQLKLDGYQLSNEYNNAELVIVNTCGFIDSAKQESLDAIGEALSENGKVIVTGCMGKNAEDITSTHPKVLSVSGPQQYEIVMTAVRQHAPIQRKPDPLIDLVPEQGVKLTPRHYAYLKISEGCNHKCTFCIIPDLRGKHISRPINDILEEAERLVRSGVKELLIISQDTSAYGVDIKYKTEFWNGQPVKSNLYELCKKLASLGIWVRLHYVYPYPHVDDIIPLMADGLILPYLDIPFQHASSTILKAMRRPAHAENTLDRIKQWRNICPDLTIRSTFIVGFPGETEEDFQTLLDFIEVAEIDRAGCFKYSAVDGAQANLLANPVEEEIKEERWHRFMQIQQNISRQKLEKKIGLMEPIIIDSIQDNVVIARSRADAPEIDGLVYLPYQKGVQPGDKLNAIIEEADDYDLYAKFV